MQLKVLYHGNCFDGCASAALFSRFFVEREGGRLEAESFVPVHHGPGDPFPKDAFDADVNACVDFRFSASPSLHWWFDHHASAFPTPADRAAFERDTTGQEVLGPDRPELHGLHRPHPRRAATGGARTTSRTSSAGRTSSTPPASSRRRWRSGSRSRRSGS